ncbi:LytR family transcriptional regulator [Scytonema tolypothrichoides VB-61278]|nr:LytR family transcriptional regulator [Scytonema tolypothrichoides VB-61278]
MNTNKPVTVQKTSATENHHSHNNKTKGWLGLCLGLTGLAVVSVTATELLTFSLNSTPLMQADLSPHEAAVFDSDRISQQSLQFSELTRPVNILVMGMSVLSSDIYSPPKETKNLKYLPQVNSFDGLSDVMLLLRFHPEKKTITMLSIPRDTRVPIEGHGTRKINVANVQGGLALSTKTVSQLLGGVGIDRYVRINVLGVSKLIDALGGVTVDVPKDMKYQDHSQHLYINLKAGKQHLNGDKALQLLRYRHDGLGDIGRVQRQQMVMRSLMEQTLNPNIIGRFPEIIKVIQAHIDTNLTVEELMTLAGFGMQNKDSNVEMLTVPGRYSQKGELDASYWIPDSDRIAAMMTQNFDLEQVQTLQASDPSTLHIDIQDTTLSDSISVQDLITKLQEAGYTNVSVSNSWSEPVSVSEIVAQQTDSASAEAIRKILGFGKVQAPSTPDLDSHITIVLGKDWLPQQDSGFQLSTIHQTIKEPQLTIQNSKFKIQN